MSKSLFCFLLSLIIGHISVAQPWPMHTIDNSSSGADGVKLADLNQDGYPDIATGWEESGLTRLYLHPGPAAVKQPWPAVTVGETPKVEDAVFADLDGDGRPEIISCTEKGAEKIYVHWAPPTDFLNPTAWKQEVLPAAENVTQWMYAEPLQLDGKNGPDLIAAGKGNPSQIGWFEAPKEPERLQDWIWHPISPVGWIMSIVLFDMDGDRDQDIVITDRTGPLRACRWLENPGSPRKQSAPWTSHLIGAAGLEVMFMDLADLDGDGVAEVVVSERTEQSLRIFTRQNAQGTQWREQRIPLPRNQSTAKSVTVGDLNGDKIPDLVISTNTNGSALTGLYWLDGRQIRSRGPLTFQAISGIHNAKYDKVALIDLDVDGDLDVLICEENYGPNSEGLGVIWYENILAEAPVSTAAKPQDLYLLIGQSNMAGRAVLRPEDSLSLDRVWLFTGDEVRPWEVATNPLNRFSTIRKNMGMQRLSPAYGFARYIAAARPEQEIGLVVNARGGTSIVQWLPGTHYFEEAVSQTREALARGGTLKGIVWHQGESDSDSLRRSLYLGRMEVMIHGFREAFDDPSLPFVLGEIAEDQEKRDLFNTTLRYVPAFIPHTAVISAAETHTTDGAHFDAESQTLLGKRYAEAMLQLLQR